MEMTAEAAVDLLMELAMDVIQVPHKSAGEMRFMELLRECDDYADGNGALSGTIPELFLQLSRLYFRHIDTQEPCPLPFVELLVLRNRMVTRERQHQNEGEWPSGLENNGSTTTMKDE